MTSRDREGLAKALVFRDAFRIAWEDKRRECGERRYQTVGEIDGLTYLVVYTQRGGRTRIISARRAEQHEDRTYREGPA